MHLSLNEVETTTRKALIGTGVDPGTAADVATGVRWLCEHGHDGIGTVLSAINDQDDLAAVVRVVDAAIAGEGELVAVDRNVVLFAGLCGPAAAVFGVRFELTGVDWSAVIGAAELAGSIGKSPAKVRTVPEGASASPSGGAAPSEVDQADWGALGAFAARTYVPSSAQSRASGAGAGLTDND